MIGNAGIRLQVAERLLKEAEEMTAAQRSVVEMLKATGQPAEVAERKLVVLGEMEQRARDRRGVSAALAEDARQLP